MISRHLPSAALNQPQAVGWGFDMADVFAAPDSLQPRRSTSLPTEHGLHKLHQNCIQGASMSPQDAVVQAGLEQQDTLVHLLLEKVSRPWFGRLQLHKLLLMWQIRYLASNRPVPAHPTFGNQWSPGHCSPASQAPTNSVKLRPCITAASVLLLPDAHTDTGYQLLDAACSCHCPSTRFRPLVLYVV
jgi:hypothetical protein